MDRVAELIAGVDWAAVTHAYGPATDTPEHLAALTADGRLQAFDRLLGSIWHQSTVYSATVAAVPVLAEIARTRRAAALHPLLLLVVCAEADDRRSPARSATREAIGTELQALVDVTLAEGEAGPTYLWPLTAGLAALLPHASVSGQSYAALRELLGGTPAAVLLAIRDIARGRDHDDDIWLSPISELSWQLAYDDAHAEGLEVFVE
jgi:hypothetical protein